MKLMNEVKAEIEGIVRAIHVENAAPGRVRPAALRAGAARTAGRWRRGLVGDVLARPGREPRRDRRARDPAAARARRRGGRRLLDRRRGRAARPARRPRRPHRAAARRARATCSIPSIVAAAATTGCEAVHPGYGFLAENAGVRAHVRRQRPRLRRPAGAGDGRGWATRSLAKRGDARGRRAARARHRGGGEPRRGARRRPRSSAIPVLLKAAAGGGGRGMRLVHGAGELDDAYGARRREARGRVRRRDALRREGDRAGAPRRDPGDLRRPRRRPHARRARVLDPAPPPEADRGDAVAGADAGAARGDGGRRRARLPRTSGTRTRARSSSCSGPTARSPSSS